MPKKKQETPTETSTETEEIATTKDNTVVPETPAESGETGGLSQREQIYAKYAKGEEEKTKVGEYKKEDAPKEIKQEDKTVPLGALHEERQKRKELQAKVIDLEVQVKELLENKKSQDNPDDFDDFDDEYIDDYDEELIKERKKTEDLEARLKKIERKETQSEAQNQQAEVNKKANKVHDELAEEGYDGFEAFIPQVKQHIYDLILQEPDAQEYIDGRKVLALDNPEGWKEIYREHIYPKVRNVFDSKDKADLIKERKERKGRAALSGSSGGKLKAPATVDVNSLSPEEMHKQYMQMRQNRGAAV